MPIHCLSWPHITARWCVGGKTNTVNTRVGWLKYTAASGYLVVHRLCFRSCGKAQKNFLMNCSWPTTTLQLAHGGSASAHLHAIKKIFWPCLISITTVSMKTACRPCQFQYLIATQNCKPPGDNAVLRALAICGACHAMVF